MYTLVWSPKGGSGTTVVACGAALVAARSEPTVIIDLGGDVAAALGIETPGGPGVADWLASPRATGASLFDLATPINASLALVHPGELHRREFTDVHAERIADACTNWPVRVVIDAGAFIPAPTLHRCSEASLLVIRPCYLALRRATRYAADATGVIVITEPGRALSSVDVERSLGRPVVGEIPWDPGIARSVDAGLLAHRLPAFMVRTLARAGTVGRST